MHETEIKSLIKKYQDGKCSAKEQAILETWYNGHSAASQALLSEEAIERNLKKVSSRLPLTYIKTQTRLWPHLAAAASIIMVMAAGLFYYQYRSSTKASGVVNQDIGPGANKAFLILADGKKISLTDAAQGSIATQSGTTIIKAADGQLIYSARQSEGNLKAKTCYNTIETPKGGQYRVQLPDGTEVWLNAQSSLRYPATFHSMDERRVELSGEGYFQVAKDKAHPFIVKSMGQTVKVLGTHFNINSYADEPAAKTTLLEGLVQLNGRVMLHPGDQARLPASGEITVSKVDLDEAVAWKNGKFVFADENIKSIMRKLERWYNVEVSYVGVPPNQTFTASISRFDHINKILDKLSYTDNVHFKIEGRRILVMK